ALEQAGEGVLIVEAAPLSAPGPRIVFGNAAAAGFYGRTPESLAGQPCGQLVPDAHWPALADALGRVAGGESVEFTTAAPGNGGRLLSWRLTAASGGPGEPDSFIAAIRCPAEDLSDPSRIPAGRFPEARPDPAVWQGDLLDAIRETARNVAHE